MEIILPLYLYMYFTIVLTFFIYSLPLSFNFYDFILCVLFYIL